MTRLRKLWNDNALTAIGLGAVLIYQVANFAGTSHWPFPWEWLPFSFRIGDHALVLPPVPAHDRGTKRRDVDWSSRQIANLGGELRYRLGSLPPEYHFFEQREKCIAYQRLESYFQLPQSDQDIDDSYLRHLRAVKSNLDSLGVDYLFLPVPTRLSIERDSLPSFPELTVTTLPRPRTEDPDTGYRKLLTVDPSRTIDLMAVYRAYRSRYPAELLYPPTETHWSSQGITLAAQAAVEKLQTLGWRLSAPEVLSLGELPTPCGGNLLEILTLSDRFRCTRPEFEYTEPLHGLSPVTSAPQSRLVVFGTSFSARHQGTPYSFGKVLAESLGRTLIDASFDDSRTLGSFRKFTREGHHLQKGDLVVVEFPFHLPWNRSDVFPTLELDRALAGETP